MNRLFGYGNKKSQDQLIKESSQAMNAAQQNLQSKMSQLDTEITQINFQLTNIQKRLSKIKSPSGQKPLRNQALKLLTKRKKLESMKDSMESQEWSMAQASMMNDTINNTLISVNAMKQHNALLKSQFKKIDLDKLEDMQDEMIDLIEQNDELQNILSEGFNTNLDLDEFDEAELDGELEALAEDMENDEQFLINDTGLLEGGEGTVPSYLNDSIPQFIDEDPEQKLTDKTLENA
ncbi:hypothetical protein KAFR_0G01300 [Kazachstania africana CBS 2517]|uniref:Vacuolar protein-sorting-associated protein 60 n=1 Tax=Kazachstania africana (strain ATCC 22294 / BCRC 22015 / CBS 2517 / CECT 1963 / NBRC 1671 / NRRL Y-8276) TaxID=1071382 RepID=H2AXR4_KAZAF|nr:hypothetical protein KAFR_0G01300 [Kazachstania africana CBS 2517]CCF59164.1 hypothetical protein KAFR_0G01300 [Kazachstania africana CBS 2517]